MLDLVTRVVTVCAARWVILYILPPGERRSKQLAIATIRRHIMKYLLLPFSPSRP